MHADRLNPSRRVRAGFLALVAAACTSGARADGIPVFDPLNYAQAVSEVSTLAQQLANQEQQIRQMLADAQAPSQQIWNQATATITQLINGINSLQALQAVSNQSQDASAYLACISSAGASGGNCTPADQQNSRIAMTQAQKTANDKLVQGLQQAQNTLQTASGTLEQLQQASQAAGGASEQRGYMNQLLAHIDYVLLNMHGLSVATANVVSANSQAEANSRAQAEAKLAGLKSRTFTASH